MLILVFRIISVIQKPRHNLQTKRVQITKDALYIYTLQLHCMCTTECNFKCSSVIDLLKQNCLYTVAKVIHVTLTMQSIPIL